MGWGRLAAVRLGFGRWWWADAAAGFGRRKLRVGVGIGWSGVDQPIAFRVAWLVRIAGPYGAVLAGAGARLVCCGGRCCECRV